MALCCDFFLFQKAVFANSKSQTSDTPTRIRSDIIDIRRKLQTIDFLGNVVVEKDDSSLLAQKMKVIYVDKNQDDLKEKEFAIKKIEAKENVKIFSAEFIASADFGFYEPKEDVFILEQNVIVNNGTSIASGDKFIYDLKKKKGNFIGQKNETSFNEKNSKTKTDKRVVVVIGDDAKEIQRDIKKVKKPKINND
jgi:lipopolysaccharide transport protein LptA